MSEDIIRRQWKGLCDLAAELDYDTQRPALQELYFEGIEMWLRKWYSFSGGEQWDTKRSGSSSEPSTSS
jgi:hypothetical protein